MFLLPFAKKFRGRGADVTDVVEHFMNVDTREMFYAKAKHRFKMPGGWCINGGRPMRGVGPRWVTKGQAMLVIVDTKLQTAKIEVKINNEFQNFYLESYEFKAITDYLDIVE